MEKRIIGIDILRASAILMVLIFHSINILTPLKAIPVVGNILKIFMNLCTPFGLLGVELFFAISGFLIGTILIKTFVNADKFGIKEIMIFWVRRWFRTLPNYWIILVFNIILYKTLNLYTLSNTQIFKYLFFLQNFTSQNPIFFGESWSLSIEEWFYLTVPIVIYIIYKVNLQSRSRKVLLYTFIFYAIVFLVRRCLITQENGDILFFDSNIRKVVMNRLDAIGYGFLFAYLIYFHKNIILKNKVILLITGLFGIIMLSILYFLCIFPGYDLYVKNHFIKLFLNTVYFSLMPIFFSMFIPFALTITQIKKKRLESLVLFVSKISYSLYLIHFTLIFVPFFKNKSYTVLNCFPFYALYLIICFSFSYTLFRFYEVPMMNLRQRFSNNSYKV